MNFYNQNAAMHCAIPLVTQSIRFWLQMKDSKIGKKHSDPYRKLQSSRVTFDFSTKWCNYGEENLECAGCLSNIFCPIFGLTVPL